MLTSAVGRHFTSVTHKAAINRTSIEIEPLVELKEEVYIIDLDDKIITEPIKLEISHVHGKKFSPEMVDGKHVVAFSNEILQCSEVLLRHWREGDRFRPFGMKGSKLLSDLFTDLKFSEKQKKETWILEADGEILWVIGLRSARAFKVPSDSANYVIISVD